MRLDYFLISSSLQNRLVSCDILTDIAGSDHCPIQLMMCTAHHVRQLVLDHKLPAYFVGKRAYIPIKAVAKYMVNQMSNTDSYELFAETQIQE